MAALHGEIPDRVPVCLHNFLPAAREAGIPLSRYLTDPRATADVHLAAVRKYGHDCILLDLDTTTLAEAMGARRDSVGDGPSHIAAPAIASLDEVDSLRPVDPQRDGRIPVLLEAVRILAREVGGEIAIRGNADQSAFSLAGLLRGMQAFLVDLVTEPDHPGLQRLLDVAHESHLAVHRAVKEAGADFTSLGDSLAGPDVVSPAIFRRFARPYHERLIRDLAEQGTTTLIHICGDTSLILDQFAEYPSCAFEIDYKTDPDLAKVLAGRDHTLVGNIDPSSVMARGTPDEVREACRRLMDSWKPGGRFILNSGCALPASTPPENIQALVESASLYGRYDH
jgi:uroporphyrinogen decarboxylase